MTHRGTSLGPGTTDILGSMVGSPRSAVYLNVFRRRRGLFHGHRGLTAFYLHTQAEAHLGEDLFDLVERLAAEILGFEHLALALLHQLTDILDIGVLQAVSGTNRKFELVDPLAQVLVEIGAF